MTQGPLVGHRACATCSPRRRPAASRWPHRPISTRSPIAADNVAAVRRMSDKPCASDVPAAANTTESPGRQPHSMSRCASTATVLVHGPSGSVTITAGMPAGGHMGGQVDADVVPAREECRHHRDRPVGGQCAKDLFRRRPNDVDERDVHRSVELLGRPGRPTGRSSRRPAASACRGRPAGSS